MDLDVKEAYEFSIINQFLINEEELQNLINDINREESADQETVPGGAGGKNLLQLDLQNIENSSDDDSGQQSEDNDDLGDQLTPISDPYSQPSYHQTNNPGGNNLLNPKSVQFLRTQ